MVPKLIQAGYEVKISKRYIYISQILQYEFHNKVTQTIDHQWAEAVFYIPFIKQGTQTQIIKFND